MHKPRRKTAEEMIALYQKSKKVPVAYQLFAKDRLSSTWHPLGQQRKYKTDAEKDIKNVAIGMNPIVRAEFKKFEVKEVPALRGELWQRQILRTLQKKPALRGFVENFVGVTELKVAGVQTGLKFLPF